MASVDEGDTPAPDAAGAETPAGDHKVASVGTEAGHVDVTIGAQFLQLFSERMYSSPNKAFEELVTNSWDAGASAVHIGLSKNLKADDAAVWVLDNGESMDDQGLDVLWNVAHSTKPARSDGRPQIGKFGIGKLSTYILAHELTYVCKYSDGVIRAVTMDYRSISQHASGLHIEPLPLAIRRLEPDELPELLADTDGGEDILRLIDDGVPPREFGDPDEFGEGSFPEGQPLTASPTWTLALLTSLKDPGKRMQRGHIRRRLRTALPLGRTISVVYCGEALTASKSDLEPIETWTLGPDLGIKSFAVKLTDDPDDDPVTVDVTEMSEPYPHLLVDGIEGPITGTVRLYDVSISGGKSAATGASNGFFVNVLGRVINPTDQYFGLSNLNHTVWAQMRAAVRIDGLNDSISVDRESVSDDVVVVLARGLLRALFNRARAAHDAATRSAWPDAGQVLTERWGTIPLGPLRRVLDQRLSEGTAPPPFVGPIDDDRGPSWDDPGEAEVLSEVSLVHSGPNAPLVSYEPYERVIQVNMDHPFAREHGETHEEQLLLRDFGLVELLSDAFLADQGIDDEVLLRLGSNRDQLLRLVARVRRRSGAQLAELLDEVTHAWKPLERAVTESLEYLGFVVDPKSGSGEPEGVAIAPLTPGESGQPRHYTFTFDAKASKDGKVANGDVKAAGLVRHRQKYSADHILVVGPDFARGAFDEDCINHSLTPMRTGDLSALLLTQATRGPIDLESFRSLFELRDLDEVHEWVESLAAQLETETRLTYGAFFDALVAIGFEEPDVLTDAVVAREIRNQTGNKEFPQSSDVVKVIDGLQVLFPNLMRRHGSQIYLGAEPSSIRDQVVRLLANVPERYQFAARLAGV